MAEAYIPNPDDLPIINHKDETKTHNYINNLEWCDKKYNTNYGTGIERHAKAISKSIYCVELDKVYESLTQAAVELGLNTGNISRCCQGKAKTTGGYHFRYKEVE